MNYNYMTDNELIHYLELYNTDPIVNKLLDIIAERGKLIPNLVKVGMDEYSCEFESVHNEMYSPADYIEHLRNEAQYYETEYDDLHFKYDELLNEAKRLQTKPVAELISDLYKEIYNNRKIVEDSERKQSQLAAEHATMKNKLDMWAILNQ